MSSTALEASVLLAGTLLLLLGGAAHAQSYGFGPCPSFQSKDSFTSAPSGDYVVLLSFDPHYPCAKVNFGTNAYTYTYYDTYQPNPNKQTITGSTSLQATTYTQQGYIRFYNLPLAVLGADVFGTSTLYPLRTGTDYWVVGGCTEYLIFHLTYAYVLVPLATVASSNPATIKSDLATAGLPNAANLYTGYSTTMCAAMPVRL